MLVTVTARATGWPMMVGVVKVGVVGTRYGRGARVYTAHRGWLAGDGGRGQSGRGQHTLR